MISTTNLNHIFIFHTNRTIIFFIKKLNLTNHNSTITTHSIMAIKDILWVFFPAHSEVITFN